jgi:fatty-acyl-CoA synthase
VSDASTKVPKGGVTPYSRRVMNLAHFLRQSALRHGEQIGLVRGEQTWTWRQIDRRVDAMTAALAARGIGKGDRVLVQSKNCVQLFESMFVCFRLGAVWVPANFRSHPQDIAYLAQLSGAAAMICGREFADHAAAARKTQDMRSVVVIGQCAFGEDYDDLVAQHEGQAAPTADVQYDDPCWFFCTSGTTGRPKAGVLTHGQMAFVVTNHLCDLMPATNTDDASLVVAPLSHGAGIHQLVQTARGARTILLSGEHLDAEEVWRLVARWRVTNLFTVPTILKLLSEHPAVDVFDHSSLRYVIYAGAPMYREDQKHALKKLGKVIVQYFGLGEVTGNITVLPASLHSFDDGPDARVGTCGFERTGMQVVIQDDSGRILGPRETGEICVCGPAVFAGYYNNPKANAKAFRNGWFRTGDLGYLDAEGFLYITGRASDMYISGGSNVYPREIEEKILAHPAVAEVAIVGVPDRVWGEVGIAVCVLKDGTGLTEAKLIAWLEDKASRYKIPKRVLFWDALPRSAYGKITKKDIRLLLEERNCLPPEAAITLRSE